MVEIPPPKARRGRFRAGVGLWISVGLLVAVPFLLGAAIGWWGLNPQEAERLSPVGGYAHQLLGSFPDGRLVVEIASTHGDAPPASSVSVLWTRMNETLSKSSISFVSETVSSGQGTYSTDDLFSVETAVRQHWPSPGQMALFFLFVRGSYAGGSGVLGLAFHGSSIAVFPSEIAANVPGGQVSGVTATVMVHEFGHELGLVGLVGSAPNEDPTHPGHSTDPNDVMYWAVESTAGILGLLGGGSTPTQFDAQDLADLQTVRNTPLLLELLPYIVGGVFWTSAGILYFAGRRARKDGQGSKGEPPAA
jgi:hypothetical protein